MLSVTRYELFTIRLAILSLINDDEDKIDKASDALRIVNAILDKDIYVIPAVPTEKAK